MEDKETRPTIETVLERISTMEGRLTERMDGLTERVDKLTGGFDAWEEELNIRLDRIESVASRTRSDPAGSAG